MVQLYRIREKRELQLILPQAVEMFQFKNTEIVSDNSAMNNIEIWMHWCERDENRKHILSSKNRKEARKKKAGMGDKIE